MDTIKNQLQISVSNNGYVDEGEGIVSFPTGLTITDNTVMRSGTRYDIDSLDIENYPGQLTGDHVDSLGNLIGKVIGVSKSGNRITVNAIKYAIKENPYARLAYNLLVGGFSNSFSIETLGPMADSDGVYRNHELVGLSQVVVPNNYNAKLNKFNEIVHNSLERSQQDGFDTTGMEEKILNRAINTSLQLAPEDREWDGSAALARVKAWASDEEGNIDFSRYRRAFFWVDPEMRNLQGGYKLGFADVIDGELMAVWRGVATSMAALNGARARLQVPDEDREGIYRAISRYYRRFKKPVPELAMQSVTIEEENMANEKELNASEIETTDVLDTVINETEVVATEVLETVVNAEEAEIKVENEAEAEEVEAPVAEEPAEEASEDAPEAEEAAEESEEAEEAEAEEEVENKTNKNEEKLEMTAEQIAEIVANAVKPLADELAATKELAQNALDSQAKEPEFETVEVTENSYDSMSAEELFAKQLNAAVAVERLQSVEAAKTLNEINARNLKALKDAKIVNSGMTLEDLGNFVIGPELWNQVATARTDYSALLNATTWRETNAIEFGWLTRSSDIDMQNVALGITGDDGSRLKPVSTPAYGAQSEKLEEMAAVTPISVNVIKFAAADILADVAEGYRNDYDKKRAQLVIARMQQAVDATNNKEVYDMSEGLVGWAKVVAKISDATTVGTLVFNNKTLAFLKGEAIKADMTAILSEISTGSIMGTPFIVVPNDLLPTLNTTETKTFKVHGANVTINQAVFYADMRTWTGRTSGGLKYDVDGSASYEVDGTVYSAYQRNEVVLRGSFFRGGVIKDNKVVASIPAIAVS